jgi:hypothetical protein
MPFLLPVFRKLALRGAITRHFRTAQHDAAGAQQDKYDWPRLSIRFPPVRGPDFFNLTLVACYPSLFKLDRT